MPVRLKDIANDLNLSQMTVSRVLRGHIDVSPETKARVLQRVKELNYRPNAVARSLRTGHTSTMGLIVPSLREAYASELAKAVDETIRAAGYELIVCLSENGPASEQRNIELLLAHQVDALLIVSIQESASFFESLYHKQKVPLIFINHKSQDSIENSIFVGIREMDVGRIATEHMISIGCRRIAYLRGPRTYIGDLRYSGFRNALRDSGLTHYPDLVIDGLGAEISEYRRGFNGMLRLSSGRNRPDGLVAYSDMMAIGAMDAAQSKGIEIPKEIAVIGSGNEVRLCEMRVSLSSIDTAGYEVGQSAGRTALRRLSGAAGSGARNVLIAPKLVVRGSSIR
jgi:LacI family transcriptional regulator